MQGSDLLGHQLLLDLVNEHQVIQLKGLTGHAQQQTAATCERLSPQRKRQSVTAPSARRQIKKHGGFKQAIVSFTETPVLNG